MPEKIFSDIFFISLTKLVLEAKSTVSSKIKEKVPLYCRNFLAFVIAVIV